MWEKRRLKPPPPRRPANPLRAQHANPLHFPADADIIVFDPATVIDKATFENPAQYSYGFHYVLVARTPVVRNGKLEESLLPGQPIRATFK